jgi:hypothetical protein
MKILVMQFSPISYHYPFGTDFPQFFLHMRFSLRTRGHTESESVNRGEWSRTARLIPKLGEACRRKLGKPMAR